MGTLNKPCKTFTSRFFFLGGGKHDRGIRLLEIRNEIRKQKRWMPSIISLLWKSRFEHNRPLADWCSSLQCKTFLISFFSIKICYNFWNCSSLWFFSYLITNSFVNFRFFAQLVLILLWYTFFLCSLRRVLHIAIKPGNDAIILKYKHLPSDECPRHFVLILFEFALFSTYFLLIILLHFYLLKIFECVLHKTFLCHTIFMLYDSSVRDWLRP